MTTEETLIEAADLLQGWHGLDHIGAKEVLAWWDGEPMIVFRGDAQKMTRYAFNHEGLNNYNHALDMSLQRTFGLDPEPEYRGAQVANIRHQFMTVPRADISEFLDGVARCLQEFFEAKGFEVYPHVTLMPMEGSPWNYNDVKTNYYNAKKQRVLSTSRPKWLIDVNTVDDSGAEIEAVGADLCQIIDVVTADGKYVAGAYESGYDDLVLVTHCLGFDYRVVDEKGVADFINTCGGFLFPSLAVGSLPAANFGPVCLVFDPSVVLQGLKPYKKGRGPWPITTYTTDVWTGTMHEFLGKAPVEMYQQLTGRAGNFMHYAERNFWVLGPKVELDAGPAQAKLVKNTKQLRTQLKRRARIWKRGLSEKKLEQQTTVLTEDRYPYLEAKSNSIISPQALVACVYPADLERRVNRFLRDIAFQGIQVPLDRKYDPYSQAEVYDWSWAIHDTIDGLGEPILRIDL